MDYFQDFFKNEIPWARIGLYLILSTFLLGNISTYLRKKYLLKDGYSRKINHVGIMLISIPTLAFLPDKQLIPAIFIGSIGLILIYGMAAISNTWWIHGIISGSLRERDSPRKRFFFFFPLISFNATLVFVTFFFPLYAIKIAFFTVALADGFAEPIGLRYGANNTFQVKDVVWKKTNTKSIAGSSTVLIFAALTSIVLLTLSQPLTLLLLVLSIFYGVCMSILEAISPRGMDNMLIILVATPLVVMLMGIYRLIMG